MKLTLALVLVSLSVLTAAKQDFVRKRMDHEHRECGNFTDPSCSIAHSGTHINSPSRTHTHTFTGSRTPSSTPSPQVLERAITDRDSSGWVQSPKGNASFTTYDNCQDAGKSCAHIFSGFRPTLSVTSSYSVRPVSERVLRRGQHPRIRRVRRSRWSLWPLL
jgi:hypothetical protein